MNKALLETAYGRFWRRFPVPEQKDQLPGEAFPDENHRWVNKEENGRLTFDQIQYVIDQLNENPKSRRIVVNAWNPQTQQSLSCHLATTALYSTYKMAN